MTVYVHPSGLCESGSIGSGTRIWAFAHVLSGAVVGADCNICDHAFIESGASLGDRVTVKNAVLVWNGVRLEDDVFVGPGVVFTNDLRPRSKQPFEVSRTLVGRGASIGANATILCGITLGQHCFVAAGAVVTADVPAHAFVVGAPARQHGWACGCGATLDERLCCGCGRRFELVARDQLREATASRSTDKY